MALAHNHELVFRQLDEQTVRVRVGDELTHVDLVFDSSGDILGARTTTRSRGDAVLPWEGRFSDFKDFGGIRAPTVGKVWWETSEGPFVYWRGRITSLLWS